MAKQFLDEAKAMEEQIIAWRRDLHQIPEIGTTLPQTVAYIKGQLDEMGIAYNVMEDISCIVCQFGQGEKCILLRADIDGLPGEEQSGEPFSSTNGCMHACGHDMHAATMLAVCKLLKAHESELKGVVKCIFQSGEEVFAGAKGAIERGILENPKVDVAFGMHSFAQYDVGTIISGNLFMGAVYGFKIHVHGVGGHGSQPERCCDPINAGVQIFQGLQELLARECPPKSAASLTIGHFEGGQAANAIPAYCLLEGTLRTFEPETRELLIRRINEIAPALAAAYKCTAEVEEVSNVPCNISEPELTQMVLKSVEDIATGFDTEQYMGSEDFAFYTEKVQSAYIVIGSGVDNPAERLGQHNPKIRFNEKALAPAVACYLSVAKDWLDQNA